MDKKGTIYIVDDDSSALKGLTRFLFAAGYEVHAYALYDELLKSPVTDKNACLILDARMPGLSGTDLQAELEKMGIKLPVIFVTADDDEETLKKAWVFKAAGFFRKPVDGHALLDAIAWAVETYMKNKESEYLKKH